MAADSAINTAAAAVEQQTTEPEVETSILSGIIDETVAKNEQLFNYATRFSQTAAQSQYFKDVARGSQALMKIMAGYELGLTPMVSLMHVHIIKEKVGLDGNLIATLLRKAGYTWGFQRHDENGCSLAFLKNGKPLIDPATSKQVVVTFERKDAERAGLTEKQGEKKDKPSMYDKYPKSMFYNRCITFFQKWYAPEISNGITVYTPDELGAEVDAGGNVVAEPAPAAQMPRRKEASE